MCLASVQRPVAPSPHVRLLLVPHSPCSGWDRGSSVLQPPKTLHWFPGFDPVVTGKGVYGSIRISLVGIRMQAICDKDYKVYVSI